MPTRDFECTDRFTNIGNGNESKFKSFASTNQPLANSRYSLHLVPILGVTLDQPTITRRRKEKQKLDQLVNFTLTVLNGKVFISPRGIY